ncbi:MAG: translesion error-prone DNA polymerase V autoproteolytic subunit [Candidatus Dojkabacteria bacterium]|nr:translesion error-prone DNA polymerase V autoproteolytic subunit [Candidatus Dojkabacteria bacterium]
MSSATAHCNPNTRTKTELPIPVLISDTDIPPFATSSVPAGFPSPAEEFTDNSLDIQQLLVRHPAATFFVRVSGTSMRDAGILSGDILVVDRAVEPSDRAIVVAVIDGEFTVKRLRKTGKKPFLAAENSSFAMQTVRSGFEVWGVVTAVIHPYS